MPQCVELTLPQFGPGRPVVCAIKIHQRGSYDNEISNLLRINQEPHRHLIQLLFSFNIREDNYLVFPWAKGHLRHFWIENESPLTTGGDAEQIVWFFEQCHGIVDGLNFIHNHVLGTAAAAYGTHGDLKPENILWFDYDPMQPYQDHRGVFKICDFGGCQFHSLRSRSHVETRTLHHTDNYRAPEFSSHEIVGQRFDAWSLGCVFLEFVTWFLGNWNAVEEFSKERTADSNPDIAFSENIDFLERRREKLSHNHGNDDMFEDSFFHLLGKSAKEKVSVRQVCGTPPPLQSLRPLTRTEIPSVLWRCPLLRVRLRLLGCDRNEPTPRKTQR